MEMKRVATPLSDGVVEELKAGDKVLLSGTIYTARDAAHKRFIDTLRAGGSLPFVIEGQVIYYCGPSPVLPGRVIGAALLSKAVVSYEVVAYRELGPEAVARLVVKELSLFVINDIAGNDLYEMGMSRYRR